MMQTTTGIKRSGELDDLLRNFTPQTPEEVRAVQQEGNNPFPALLKRYKAFLDVKKEYTSDLPCYNATAEIRKILSPEEINTFLQTTIKYEDHENYEDRTGFFLSRLLQNSYNAGNNDFHLNIRNIGALDNLGVLLKGTKEMSIKLTITGDVGERCGANSTYGIYTITGNVGGLCGVGSKNGIYTITSNVGVECGYESTNGIYNIIGNVGRLCSWISRNGTYKTPNKQIAERLKQHSIAKSNTVIYITPEGTEEVIRK